MVDPSKRTLDYHKQHLHVRDLSTCAVQTTVACRTGEFRERNAFCFRLVLRARVSRFAVCSANPPFLQPDFQGSFLRTEYLIPVFHSPFSPLDPLVAKNGSKQVNNTNFGFYDS